MTPCFYIPIKTHALYKKIYSFHKKRTTIDFIKLNPFNKFTI